jgi:hypothetical protein
MKRKAALFGLLVLTACAAPDAIPGPPGAVGPYQPTPGQGGDPIWAVDFGQAAQFNVQRGYDIAVDKSTGTAFATFGFDAGIEIPDVVGTPFVSAGNFDVLLVQLSGATGKPVWAKMFGDAAEQTRTVVDVDIKGNVILAGGFDGSIDIGTGAQPTKGNRDVWVAKLDPEGKPLWIRTFGEGSSQFATDVATDGEGNVIVVGFADGGEFEFDTDLLVKPAAGNDIFAAKLDPTGKTLWAERIGRAASSDPNDPTACVAVSRADGSILIGGAFSGTLAFPDLSLPVLGKEDGFVAKLDTYGKGIWGKTFGDLERTQRVESVAFGPSASALVTGSFSGKVDLGGDVLEGNDEDYDLLVAKLDAGGNHLWSHGYGSGGDQRGRQIALDAKGSVVVVGAFEGVLELYGKAAIINADVDGRWDILAAHFSVDDGATIWGRSYGDRENQRASAAVVDQNGNTLIVGTNEGALRLGGMIGDVMTSGAEDAFVMSIEP